MMRSGWHVEWEARLATGRARADAAARLAAVVRTFDAMRPAVVNFGVSAAQAVAAMNAMARAMRDAERTAKRYPPRRP